MKKKTLYTTVASCLFSVGLLTNVDAFAVEEENDKKHTVGEVKEQSTDNMSFTEMNPVNKKVGWGELKVNKNLDNQPIRLKLDDEVFTFDKGIVAHATSILDYDISKYSEKYPIFQTYVGVDYSRGNRGSVFFKVYTSEDNKNWKEVNHTEVLSASSKAKLIRVNVKGAKYIRLEANDNYGNGDDHAAYGNPMLTTEDYSDAPGESLSVVKPVSVYDEEIKKAYKENNNTLNESIKKLILQRTFINRYGYHTINKLTKNSQETTESLNWLLNNYNALSHFIHAGEMDNGGSSDKVIKSWSELYKNYHDDFTSPVLLKLAIATAITHGNNIHFWTGSSQPSIAVDRYREIKALYKNGKMAKGIRTGNIKDFEQLSPELMRWVVDNKMHNSEMNWFANYALKEKDKGKDYLDAYNYINYTDGYNYGKEEYHDVKQAAKWDKKYDFKELYANETEYQNRNIHHLWQVFEEGSVCGGLAKTYTNVQQVFGLPASVCGQPGHAASFIYSKKNGQPVWNIYNDIFGFMKSEKGERLLLGWGSKYYHSQYNGSYILLAQAALNDYRAFMNANYYNLLANSLNSPQDKVKAYQKALEIQGLNLDSIMGLLKNMKSLNVSDADYLRFAKEVAKNLKYYPLPFVDVMHEIRSQMKSANDKAAIDSLRLRTLKEMKKVSDSEYIQANVCRGMADFLLGDRDMTVATFSFDGKDAGNIVMNERYKDSDIRWEYSLDGGKTKKEVNDKKLKLTPEEIAKINDKDGIQISFVGTDEIHKIEIEAGHFDKKFHVNDLENRLVGSNQKLEYQTQDGQWKPYTDTVRFIGDQKVKFRSVAHGQQMASSVQEFNFTASTDQKTYIPVSDISLYKFCSEHNNTDEAAKNMLDGDKNTLWHNDWGGNDNLFYSVEFNQVKNLKTIQYLPRQTGNDNGKLKEVAIYTSLDGKEWKLAQTFTNISASGEMKTFTLDKPVQAKYVALKANKTYGYTENRFFSGQLLNFFEADMIVEDKEQSKKELAKEVKDLEVNHYQKANLLKAVKYDTVKKVQEMIEKVKEQHKNVEAVRSQLVNQLEDLALVDTEQAKTKIEKAHSVKKMNEVFNQVYVENQKDMKRFQESGLKKLDACTNLSKEDKEYYKDSILMATSPIEVSMLVGEARQKN